MNKIDQNLKKAILETYKIQKDYDNSVVIVFRKVDSIAIGNKVIQLDRTATPQTLISRLQRLKEAGIIRSFDRQLTNRIQKILLPEDNNGISRKNRFTKQLQLKLS